MTNVINPTACWQCHRPVDLDGSCNCDLYPPTATGLTTEKLFWCPVHHSSGVASLQMDCWERYANRTRRITVTDPSLCRIVEATVTWKEKE